MRFIINLLCFTIVCHKAFAKFILQYNYFLQICTFLPFIKLALIISGDIECNPGPENIYNQNLSFCQTESRLIILLKSPFWKHITQYTISDLICISETFLDTDYSDDDQRLSLQGYDMIRSDPPSNTKRRRVCIYYKEHLPFVRRDDITFLDECCRGN